MTTTTVNVSDMHCADCSNKIINAITQMEGVQKVSVNPVRRRLFVSHDANVELTNIITGIQSLGFSPTLSDVFDATKVIDRSWLRRIGVAGICGMQVMMIQIALYAGYFQGINPVTQQLLTFAALMLSIPIVTYAAIPFFTSGLLPIVQRRGVNMDTPIALAIVLAFLVSVHATATQSGDVYYDSVAMFTFLMLGARYLDVRLRRKLTIADSLYATLPRQVTKLIGKKRLVVQLGEVDVGDQLWIGEGEQLPADGTLLSEYALIDSALLSGEDKPQHLREGTDLYAGTINAGPAIVLKVTQLEAETRIAQIDRISRSADSNKTNAPALADNIAKVFLPSILIVALGTFLYWAFFTTASPISATLAVLVVSCPCALSLAAPGAINAAVTALRKQGLLVRNSGAIEQAAKLRRVVFDKTGTLTESKTKLTTVSTYSEQTEQECLELASALERHVSHPIAAAFSPFDVGLEVADIEVAHGAGVSGTIEGQRLAIGSAQYCNVSVVDVATDRPTVFLSINGALTASFVIDRPLREDARKTIINFTDMGLSAALLSGDEDNACTLVADQLGIACVSNASPESKQHYVHKHPNSLFVGDGLNDLPALSTADVSLSTLESLDLVKSKADVVLLTKCLGATANLVTVSRFCRRIMHQNLAWAVLYNLVAIPIAASGLATPWLAALGMSASSILVLLNSARILRV